MKINNPSQPVTVPFDSVIEASEMVWFGNSIESTFCLPAGDYIMRVRGEMGVDTGSVTWLIDNESAIFHQSWSYPVRMINVVKPMRINVPMQGKHVLRGVFSKQLKINKIWFKPV